MAEAIRESTVDKHDTTIVQCNPDIERWLERHCKTYYNATNDNTFVDSKGVRRYLDNWVPVEEDVEGQKTNIEDSCGVCKVYFKSRSKETKYVKFLVNWEKLWKSFEEDSSDEIAAQAPLLRIFIEFFYHQRTCQLMILLVAYDIFILSMVSITADNPLGTTPVVTNAFLQLLQLCVYLALKQLYTGFILYETKLKEDDEPSSIGTNSSSNGPSNVSKKHSVHWFSTGKQMCLQTIQELKSIARTGIHIQKKNKRRNYYNLLNIALKFLSVHNEVKVTDINFNRLSYIAALLSVLSIVPAYVFYYYIFSYIYMCKFRFDAQENTFCNFVYFYGIETGAGLVLFLQYYIFIGSVFVGFVGLAYGGEIAYQLTNSWLSRYAELRRVSPTTDNINRSDTSTTAPDESKKDGNRKMSVSGGADEESKPKLFRRPSAYIKGQPGRQSISATVLQTNALTDDTFANKVSRDAYEQHLFFAAYMKEAGHLWSTLMVGFFVFMLYIISGSLYYWIKYPHTTSDLFLKDLMFVLVRVFVFFVYPVTCLAHANRYVYTVRDTFMNSAPSDYSILGGRDDWTTFINDVPAVWTLFGLWITWERILGVLWTLFVSGFAIGITVVTASVKV